MNDHQKTDETDADGNPMANLVVIVRDTGEGMTASKLEELNPIGEWRDEMKKLLEDGRFFPRFCVEDFPSLWDSEEHEIEDDETISSTIDDPLVLGLGLGHQIGIEICQQLGAATGYVSKRGFVGTSAFVSIDCPILDETGEETPDSISSVPSSESLLPRPPPSLPNTDLEVVVAEENATSRAVLRRFLEQLEISPASITMFEDGKPALDHLHHLAQDVGSLPDNLVVIADINTEFSGKLVEEIRRTAELSGLPVIACTGKVSCLDSTEFCRTYGFDYLLSKPFSLKQVCDVLAAVADRENKRQAGVPHDDSIDSLDELTLDTLTEESEIQLFGVTLRDRTVITKTSTQSALGAFVIGIAGAVLAYLFAGCGTYMFVEFCVGIVLKSIFVYVDPKRRFFYEMLLNWAGTAGFGAAYGVDLGYGAGLSLTSILGHSIADSGFWIAFWIVLCFVSFVLTEILHFILPPLLVSRESQIWFSLLSAVAATILIFNIALSAVKGSKLERDRLRSVTKRFEHQRDHQRLVSGQCAHDLGNTLSGIFTFISELRGKNGSEDAVRVLLNDLSRSFRFIQNVSVQLLEYFRFKENRLYLVPESTIVLDFLSQLKDSFDQNEQARLIWELDEVSDVAVSMDARRLQVVLSNLIRNALRFSSDVVVVKVSIMMCRTEPFCHFQFVVTDSGIGMSEEDIQAAFSDPFLGKRCHRIDPSLSSGFRLFIDQKLANLMGGRIAIRSIRNEGTTVTLDARFATTESGLTISASCNDEDLMDCDFHKNVLVLDDSNIIRFVVKRFSKSVPSRVSFCQSVTEARQIIQRHHEPFDLFLVDCNIASSRDGIDFAGRLKREFPEASVRLITADVDLQKEFMDSKEFDRVFLKPIDTEKQFRKMLLRY